LYLNNTGIRISAKIIGCSPSLLVRWVRELANNLRGQLERASTDFPPDTLPDVIEMDKVFTRVKKGFTIACMNFF
jgi:transposase-like protein